MTLLPELLHYNNENALSCVISLAYYNAVNEYNIIRELPTGYGFADMVFLPRKNSDKPAMVVELKWNQSALGAISQIKEKHYVQALSEYQGSLTGRFHVIKNGILVCGQLF